MRTLSEQNETIGTAENKIKFTGQNFMAVQKTKKTNNNNNRTGPAFDCPYDGTFCQHKETRVLNWIEAVEYHAQNKINRVFLTSADMFNNCPLTNSFQCVRRQRYEKIIKQMKQR